jgi:hypothetical protein
VPWREEAKARGATESEQVGFWVKDWKCLGLYCDWHLLHGRNMGWAWMIILHSQVYYIGLPSHLGQCAWQQDDKGCCFRRYWLYSSFPTISSGSWKSQP